MKGSGGLAVMSISGSVSAASHGVSRILLLFTLGIHAHQGCPPCAFHTTGSVSEVVSYCTFTPSAEWTTTSASDVPLYRTSGCLGVSRGAPPHTQLSCSFDRRRTALAGRRTRYSEASDLSVHLARSDGLKGPTVRRSACVYTSGMQLRTPK